jgi:hypothetical protein
MSSFWELSPVVLCLPHGALGENREDCPALLMIARLLASLPLAGCAVFAGVLFAEFEAGTRREPAATGFSAHPRSPVAAPRDKGAELDEQVAAVLARPLFNPTRRPPTVAESKSASELGLESLRLAGIITAPDRRFAIFTVTGGKPLALGEGQTVSGWQIESITPREVSLSAFGGMMTLHPQTGPAAADAVAPTKLTFDRVLPDQQTRDDE